MLADDPGRVVTHERLLELVWARRTALISMTYAWRCDFCVASWNAIRAIRS